MKTFIRYILSCCQFFPAPPACRVHFSGYRLSGHRLLVVALAATVLVAAQSRSFAGKATAAGSDSSVVVLDETGIRNLGIRTAEATESTFEETVFTLGQIEARPEAVGIVSSRIAGRVAAIDAFPGEHVEKGAKVLRIESRQAGGTPVVVGLEAPLGGLVSDLGVRLGEPVEPDRALMTITDLKQVFAVARVPETAVARLQQGALAYIRIPALGEDLLAGRLLRLGVAADAASGTVDAVFALDNPQGRIVPGMRAEFAIVVTQRDNVFSIPRRALQGTGAQRFVYVKHFEIPNAFIKTPVVVGAVNDRFAEILSGLFPADEVVTTGAYSLSFVGAGTLSLKEALDAAHGHAHNEDGSELSAGAKNAKLGSAANIGKSSSAAKRSATGKSGHSHGDGHDHGHGDGDRHGGSHGHDANEEGAHGHGFHWHELTDSVRLWQGISGVLLLALLFAIAALRKGRRRIGDSVSGRTKAQNGFPASGRAEQQGGESALGRTEPQDGEGA